ncbi:hypothetical protein G6F32_015022 [Rhizopus arrhizus]|nr:hypothetical protein G6F32_015022 [Rhizopus arrhizus]
MAKACRTSTTSLLRCRCRIPPCACSASPACTATAASACPWPARKPSTKRVRSHATPPTPSASNCARKEEATTNGRRLPDSGGYRPLVGIASISPYGFTSTHTRWWSLPSAIFASGLSLAGQKMPLPMYSKPVEGST